MVKEREMKNGGFSFNLNCKILLAVEKQYEDRVTCNSPNTDVKNQGQPHGALEEIDAIYNSHPIFQCSNLLSCLLHSALTVKTSTLLPRIKTCFSDDEAGG